MPLDLAAHYDPMDLHNSIEPLVTKDLAIPCNPKRFVLCPTEQFTS